MVSDNAATLHVDRWDEERRGVFYLVLNFLARTSSLPYPRSIGNISEFGELLTLNRGFYSKNRMMTLVHWLVDLSIDKHIDKHAVIRNLLAGSSLLFRLISIKLN